MPTAPAPAAAPAISTPPLWLPHIRYAVVYAALFLVFGIGVYSYYNGTHEGNLQQLSAADFQSGKLQARLVYADVRGHLSEKYLSKDDYQYIPMTSTKSTAGPVHVVVGINESEIRKYIRREADGTFTVRGIADKGMEGDVKYTFEKNGIALADPVWVLRAGRDPSWDRKMGLLMMGIGVVLAGFVFGRQSYQKRKRAAAQAVQATA